MRPSSPSGASATMMHFDPEFWDRRLNDRNLATIPRSASRDPHRKQSSTPRRTRICIPLPSKPRDYVPGSGPPLQPIRLLPPRDSTAYIIERVLLPSPGPAANGKPLPKRMTYLVGWHDLPAARMLVPAMQILDYVSPLTLEEWESQLEQELDDERARLEEEENSATISTKKRKRARPPAHSQIESAVVAESETVTKKRGRPRKGVMSLSTPQKTRLEEFEELSDEEDSPSRQIERETYQSLRRSQTEEVETGEGETDYSTAPVSRSSPNRHQEFEQTPSSDAIEKETEESTGRSRQPTPGWSWTPMEFSNGTQTPEEQNIPKSQPTTKQNSPAKASKPSTFTPAGKSTGRFPSDVITQTKIPKPSVPAGTSSKPTNSKPRSSKKKPKKEEEPKPKSEEKAEDDGEKAWVVERIEGVEHYEVEGAGSVRFFKVRWEGDWPPDQKTTWEPEENIPSTLIRNFMKMSKSRRISMLKKRSPKQTKLSWSMGKQYNSVSEAFAGDQDSVAMGDDIADYQDESDMNENEQDEFFVVAEEEEERGRKLNGKKMWNRNGSMSTPVELFPAFT